jgi:hypothetical protein
MLDKLLSGLEGMKVLPYKDIAGEMIKAIEKILKINN